MFGSHSPKPMPQADGSYIGEEMRITGLISASKPVILLGQIDGNIDAVVVHIRSTATVNGDINAQKVTIDGTVCGIVTADEVYLSASAVLNGEVRSKGLEIDEGALIEAKFTKEQGLNG
jgi:cytoskeletal protein CcmA (bactofilin family)